MGSMSCIVTSGTAILQSGINNLGYLVTAGYTAARKLFQFLIILPVLSSVIELIGKILFVVILIPKFQYRAVIFCELVIWCIMIAEFLPTFWRNPVIRVGVVNK